MKRFRRALPNEWHLEAGKRPGTTTRWQRASRATTSEASRPPPSRRRRLRRPLQLSKFRMRSRRTCSVSTCTQADTMSAMDAVPTWARRTSSCSQARPCQALAIRLGISLPPTISPQPLLLTIMHRRQQTEPGLNSVIISVEYVGFCVSLVPGSHCDIYFA